MGQVRIDPISRIEGHLSLKISVTDGLVEEAHVQGTMYRGFENIMAGKNPDDARIICQRICGVCHTSHGLAAVDAMEKMMEVALPDNAHILRNLLLGSEFLHSHILHFYHLCLPDYIEMPSTSPWGPPYGGDKRFPPEKTDLLIGHYHEAIRCRQKAHTIGAVIGGKMPHCASIVMGGITGGLDSEEIQRIDELLNEIEGFVSTKMVADLVQLETYYADYMEIGKGTGNFLCYVAFYDPDSDEYFIKSGVKGAGGNVFPISLALITETSYHSWYLHDSPSHPFSGTTLPHKHKEKGYSWIKSPRYLGNVYEVGPFARLAVNGMVAGNSSVLGRIGARVAETQLLVQQMRNWLNQYRPADPSFVFTTQPNSGLAVGTVEAPRGGLAHFVGVNDKAITQYQVVTPTCWNCSPRDEANLPGVLEQAVMGTQVANESEPIEVLRVVHSFDPCMACSVH